MNNFKIAVTINGKKYYCERASSEEVIETWQNILFQDPNAKFTVEHWSEIGRIYWKNLDKFKEAYLHEIAPSASKFWNYICDKKIPMDGRRRTIACYDANTGVSYYKEIFCCEESLSKETAYAWTNFVLHTPLVKF